MPSPMPPPPSAKIARPETDGERGLRIALECRGRLDDIDEWRGRAPDLAKVGDEGDGIEGRMSTIEVQFGTPPDPVRNRVATGMIGIMMGIRVALDALTAELGADRESRTKSSARNSRLAWGLGIPVAVAVLLGAGALAWRFVSTLHH